MMKTKKPKFKSVIDSGEGYSKPPIECMFCKGKLIQTEKQIKYKCEECGAVIKHGTYDKKVKSHRELVMPELIKFLDKHDTKGWKVLEVGHGYYGDFLELFNERKIEWHGIDNNIEIYVEKKGEKNKKVIDEKYFKELIDKKVFGDNYYFGDMHNMDMFHDNAFDLVFCCHTLEHSENPLQALREMKRVCKKFLFIITPKHCWQHILDGDQDHIFVFTQLQMRQLFRYLDIPDDEVYVQMKGLNEEKNYNLIAIGRCGK